MKWLEGQDEQGRINLDLDANPLLEPPLNIAIRGPAAILAHFTQTRKS